MADREPIHDDLLAFMDDDERESWDSGKGTPEDRAAFLERLRALWRSIPNPTEEDLKRLMHYVDWTSYTLGSPSGKEEVRSVYVRTWKKDRRPAAELRAKEQSETEPPEPDPPRPESEIGPTDHGIYDSMRPETRSVFDAATPRQKAQMWRGAKKRWESAHRQRTKPKSEDIVREDGYTDKEAGEYFERKFASRPAPAKPEPQRPIRREVWAEIKHHRGWYFLAFLLGGLPVGIGTIWPSLTHETVPEWLAEHGWPRLILLVAGWVAVALIIATVIIVRSYLTVKGKQSERDKD